MRELIDGHWEVDAKTDLVHHEYEDERNPEEWYFQSYPDCEVSQSFPTRSKALEARERGLLEWND